MEDFFVLNFDMIASPTLKLKLQSTPNAEICKSWGIAWYPNDNQSSIVVKEPISREEQILTEQFTERNDFRSTNFFCTVKDGMQGHSHHDTQPFSRSYAGNDWLFTLAGKLDKSHFDVLERDICQSLQPLGASGAELVFCFLLSKLHSLGIGKLSDVDPEVLQTWFRMVDVIGGADIVITDGTTIACYHGFNSKKKLYYHRMLPPRERSNYVSNEAELQFSDPRDTYRTVLLFSTAAFVSERWQTLLPGQLLLGRRGTVHWDSHDNLLKLQTRADNAQPPLAQQKKTDASIIQAEQAQTKQPTRTKADDFSNDSRQIITNTRAVISAPDGQPLTYRTFDICHKTSYSYTKPVERSTHIFRLQPVEDAIQEIVKSSINISMDGEAIQFEDVFGNHSIHYSINREYTKLVIENVSTVNIYALPPDDHSLSLRQTSIPLIWMPWQRQMMMAYLLPEELPESQLLELTDYAMSFVQRNDYHLLKTLQDMNLSIYKDYTYAQGTTSLNSTAFDCYTTRKGVCQDFANLFICLARLLGIPARYRMGYIYTGANYDNKLQSDASHAWVELYLPYVGWRGFDPTNGCPAQQDHIRVACGRNYRDATPTSGTIYKGKSTESLSVEVKVIEHQMIT